MEEEIKEVRKTIEISEELDIIFSRLRDKIKEATWGVEETSYFKLSKVLARKINSARII